MRRTISVAVLVLLLLPAAAWAQYPIVVADAEEDFSNTQGDNGWEYGCYDMRSFFTREGFSSVQGLNGLQYGWYTRPGDPTSFTTSGMVYEASLEGWRHPSNWLRVRSQALHPDRDYSAVLRWTSGAPGSALLRGMIRKWGDGGNGTLARLFVDGVEVTESPFPRFVPPAFDPVGVAFAIDVDLAVGTTIDLAVDSRGDVSYDSTGLYMEVVPRDPDLDLFTTEGMFHHTPSNSWRYATGIVPAWWDRGAHPGNYRTHPPKSPAWASRRWTSDVEGPARISGVIEDWPEVVGEEYDGVVCRIFINGEQVHETVLEPDDRTAHPYSLEITLEIGDVVDFVVDPRDRHSYDSTRFTATVAVPDSTAPVIHAVTADSDTLWPPNNKMADVAVTVDASDDHDPYPISQILGVTCDEECEGDWAQTGPLTLRLRAERDGEGDGRVYTIHVACTDSSGNTSTAAGYVFVPHDQGKGEDKADQAAATGSASPPKTAEGQGAAPPKSTESGESGGSSGDGEDAGSGDGDAGKQSGSDGKGDTSGLDGVGEKAGDTQGGTEQKGSGNTGPETKIQGDLGGK